MINFQEHFKRFNLYHRDINRFMWRNYIISTSGKKLCKLLFSCSPQYYLMVMCVSIYNKIHGFYNRSFPISAGDCDDELNLEYRYTSGCNKKEKHCSTRDYTTQKMNQIDNRLKNISKQVKNDIFQCRSIVFIWRWGVWNLKFLVF